MAGAHAIVHSEDGTNPVDHLMEEQVNINEILGEEKML